MYLVVVHLFSMSDKKTPTKKTLRRERKAMVSCKLTTSEKEGLDKLAWDRDDSVSRIIRKALAQAHPDIFERNNGTEAPFISTKY